VNRSCGILVVYTGYARLDERKRNICIRGKLQVDDITEEITTHIRTVEVRMD